MFFKHQTKGFLLSNSIALEVFIAHLTQDSPSTIVLNVLPDLVANLFEKEMSMYTIDVDFDVYKQLTIRRATEDVTYNDVVRELLGMVKSAPTPHAEKRNGQSPGDWVAKGVRFPVGTDFRANYKGQVHTASIEAGALVLSDGKRFDSPSAAAVSITGNAVNGWRFWECRLPGKSSWQLIESLRR